MPLRRPALTRVAGALLILAAAHPPRLAAQQPASIPGAPSTAAAPRRWALDDLHRVVRVSDPQIAPDGRSIAITVTRDILDENRSAVELALVDVATGASRPLTVDRQELGHARWSPDGSRLAFLAAAPPRPGAIAAATPAGGSAPSARQVFVMPMAGGEARPVTSAPNGVQHFAWHPDGTTIAYATADTATRGSGPERFNDSFEVGNNDLFAAAAPTPVHVWLVSAGGGPARRLTSGRWSLPTVNAPGPAPAPIAWSPDGKSIAIATRVNAYVGSNDSVHVQIIDVASGQMRPLTSARTFESYPAWSPDGRQISFSGPRGGVPRHVTEVHVVPAAGGPPRSVTRALDRHVLRAIWMPDGRSLLVGGADADRTSIWLQPVGGGPARKLALGNLSPNTGFWVDMSVARTGAIAVAGTESGRPPELYVLASPTATPRRLTRYNDSLVAQVALGREEMVYWDGPDGFRGNGVVVYPPDYAPGRRYPLVLNIHGGPTASSLLTFHATAQLLAAQGWVVFLPNYRGSDNLGDAYQHAITNDAGAGPGRDVMAGVAHLARLGTIDTTRMAVTGWSYGGYMTTWLIGHYPVWRAAVAGAPVTDLAEQYNLADFNVAGRYAIGGSPWSEQWAAAYREQSPITYATKVRTPTLILSNTRDYRVPPTQAYKLFRALKDSGVETQFVAYPTSGHSPVGPVRTRDSWRRQIEWLTRYMGAPPSARLAVPARTTP